MSHGRGGRALSGRRDLGERDLQFVKAVVARFVDARRLARRADEQAGEEIADRLGCLSQWMTRLFSRSGRRGTGCRAASPRRHDMVAAAGAGMLAVDHELVGAEAREPRFLVDRLGRGDAFAPARRGMDVDLDHAGVGRDADDVHARIGAAADSPRSAPAARSRSAAASAAAISSR